jgi:membrane protease subunit HflK
MQSVNPKAIMAAIIALIIISCFSTAIYTIPPDSEGVVTRFGALKDSNKQPGLHFKLPFGIDRTSVVAVKRQLKQEYGFGTTGASNPTQYSSRNVREDEKSMITGDRNEAMVEWIIQYRIDNAANYLFKVREPENTLRDVSESVMREVVGDRSVDEVLTVGRQGIESEALVKMQQLVNKYSLGLRIDQVQLKNVNPPRKVQNSFNEVNQAQQQREQSINVARGEYNKDVPRASGLADQVLSKAKGYATERINEAQGDADRFRAVYEQYQKAPEVTRRRLYLETLGDVMPKLGGKVILDSGANQVLPLLQIPGVTKSN